MDAALEEEIRELRARFRSSRDPRGRAFAPLADAYRRAGELEDAGSLVDEGVERLPDFAPGHLVAGRILRDRGERAAAARAFGRVLELDPDNVEALREAAELAEGDGRIGDALELYHRLSHLEPEEAAVRARVRELKRRRFEAERAGDPAGAKTEETEETDKMEEGEPVAAGASEPAGAAAEPGPSEPGDAASEPAAAEPPEGPPSGAVPGAGSDPDAVDEPRRAPAEEEDADEVYTQTMAELYARQGLEARAAEIYRRLAERHPDDERLRARLEELEDAAAVGAPEEEAAAAAAAAEPAPDLRSDSIARYFRRLLRRPGGEGAREGGDAAASADEIVPIEALAPDAPAEEDDDFRSWLRGMQR